MPSDQKYSPPVGFYFHVAFIGGNMKAESSFKEVSGLSMELSTEEIKEGGELRFQHKLPGVAKFPNLVLKRGLFVDSKIREWVEKAIFEFEFTPITIMISLLNDRGRAAMSWKLFNAWPVKWEVSNFDSENNSIAVETMEIAYNYFTTKTH